MKIIRVLLIEDNESQRNLLYKILLRIPHVEPYPVEDALDGYALLKAMNKVDVIVMDHNMPFVTGLEFMKKLKQTPALSEIPIIVSSFEENQEQFLQAGAKLVLTKPFDLSKLQKGIESLT